MSYAHDWSNHPAHLYAVDVSLGKRPAGKWVKLACKRYLDDLDTQDDGAFEFRPDVAGAWCDFFPAVLKVFKGPKAGEPFELMEWQKFVVWNVFGWFNRETGTRRFRYAFVLISRKNGKTVFAAALALAMAIFDDEKSPDCYFLATKKDQAEEAYRSVFEFAKRSLTVRKYASVKLRGGRTKSGGKIGYLGSNKDTLDGLDTHFGCIDEYHAHANDSVYNVIKSSMGARPNGLHFTISTEGFNPGGPMDELKKHCRGVLEGARTDEAQFALMYEMDEGDDWKVEENWAKANPSIGISPTWGYMREQFQQAVQMGGSTEVEFKTKHLNLQVAASETWIQDEVWMSSKSEKELDPSLPIWCGLDLASVSDLTALILAQPQDGGYVVRGHYFLPSAMMQEMKAKGGNPYATFEQLPNVHVTDGNVTDYDEIRRVISGVTLTAAGQQVDKSALIHTYDVRAVAFDRYNATQIGINLVSDDVPIIPFGQGHISMSPPTKQLEILARQGKIWHDGDPVLRWAMANVELKIDPAGNIKPDKGKSSNKIDPVVALVMAIGEHLKAPEEEMLFEIVNL